MQALLGLEHVHRAGLIHRDRDTAFSVASAIFRDQGFDVTAIDGSAGLAAEAQARYGLEVEVMLFEPASTVNTGDGPDTARTVRELRRI